MNGVMVIDKPRGWTSHDVVQRARLLLQEKRIGHCGTLDPLATGVLVLCAGSATRIVRYLESDDKEYEAEFRLGIVTDTLDADGKVTGTRDYQPPATGEIEAVLENFRGVIRQRPPAYSAVKVQGVPSYRLARKGEARLHPEREVVIHGISLLAYTDPLIRIRVHCSKGTYVRTLAADIGERLGTGAHLTALIRLRSGRFGLEDAVDIEELADLAGRGRADRRLITLSDALAAFPEVVLEGAAADRARNGNPVPVPPGTPLYPAGLVRISSNGNLLAVARMEKGLIMPETVLA